MRGRHDGDRTTRNPCPSGDSFAGSAQPTGGGRVSRRSVHDEGSAEGGCEGPEIVPVAQSHRTAGRQALARSDPLHKIRSSGMYVAGLFAPGNGAGGSISANNGPAGPGVPCSFAARESRRDDRQSCWGVPQGGEEGPEIVPVARFHRRTGRQALDRKTPLRSLFTP